MISNTEKAVYVLANNHPRSQADPANRLLNRLVDLNFMKSNTNGFFSHVDIDGKRRLALFVPRNDGLLDVLLDRPDLTDIKTYRGLDESAVSRRRIYPFTRTPIPKLAGMQDSPSVDSQYSISDDRYTVELKKFVQKLRDGITNNFSGDAVEKDLVKHVMSEGLFLHGDEPYNKSPHAVLDVDNVIIDVGFGSEGELKVIYLDNDYLICKGYTPVAYNDRASTYSNQETETMAKLTSDDRPSAPELDLPTYTHSELMETISSTLDTFITNRHDSIMVKQIATALVDAVSNKGAELRWKDETEELFYRDMDGMDEIHFIFRCLNEETCRYYSRGMEELRDIFIKHQYVAEVDGVFAEGEGLISVVWSSNGLSISVYSNLRGVSPMVEFSVNGDVVDFNLWLLEAVEKEETFDLEPFDRHPSRHGRSRW